MYHKCQPEPRCKDGTAMTMLHIDFQFDWSASVAAFFPNSSCGFLPKKETGVKMTTLLES
jgi:hypothetical protein